MNVYIFGDTGAHAEPLLASLQKIGVNLRTFIIPENVQIVHLGDLIHKGESSNKLVSIVNLLMRNNPDQWVQLMGNHELQHIKGAPYFWRCNCNTETVAILNEWLDRGLAKISYYLERPFTFNIPKSLKFDETLIEDKGILFSHAGLTSVFWQKIGSPATAKEASHAINQLSIKEVSATGVMLDGGKYCTKPGPAWALSTTEVFGSWELAEIPIPFVQVHGHSPAYQWQRNAWWAGTQLTFKKQSKLDVENRLIYTQTQNSLQICCDPGFDAGYDIAEQPFLHVRAI